MTLKAKVIEGTLKRDKEDTFIPYLLMDSCLDTLLIIRLDTQFLYHYTLPQRLRRAADRKSVV